MTDVNIEKGIYYSKISAIFGTVSVFLIGDLFLTAYAIFLGLSNYQIGLLSTFAIISNIANLLSSWLVEKLNIRKKLIIISTLLSNIFFLPVLFLPFIDFCEIRATSLIIIIATSNFFMAIANPVFTSWLVDLVPEEIRGKYFGIRNTIAGIIGVVFIFLAGKFLDIWGKDSPYGFIILFSTGIIFGLINVIFINKMPEVKPTIYGTKIDFLELVKLPFSNKNFISLITFRCFLQFSAVLVGVFINVYLLRELKWNYSTVALLGIVGNIFLFLPQRWWGIVSDRLSNKPIIYIGLIGVTILPLILAITKISLYYFIAVALCSLGWAAISIAEVNILFRVSKGEHSISYISIYTVLMSLAQALATLVASFIISFISFKVLFIISFFLRLISFLLVNKISEPQKTGVIEAVVIFRRAVISDIIEGVSRLVHYIKIK